MNKGPVYFNGKRNVGGTAAWLHTISKNGGWNTHHKEFGDKIIDALIMEMNEEASKPKLKIVRNQKKID